MKQSLFILLLLIGAPTYSQETSTLILNNRAQQVFNEKQPIADQGNGYYLNPVLPGNYGDPSIVRIDKDYYLAKSTGSGFIMFHSRDLVNWKPVIRHTFSGDYTRIWAVDLQYFNGKFYLYMPIDNYPGKKQSAFGNFVTISEKPEGPWSEPVNLDLPVIDKPGYSAIDPGFVQTPEGKKFLYVSNGYMITLNNEGTKATSAPKKVYEGWQYPEEWNVECMCLESPKFFTRNGFYYLVSAEGGTSGPSTAHMTIVARSKSPEGPWINSPYNPLVRTYSIEEKWWHQGHGTIFEAADGSWWTIYHARLNDYTEIGRQVLLMPVDWTFDGWPVIKNSIPSSALIPMPSGDNIGTGIPLSDDFSSELPGMQWEFAKGQGQKLRFGGSKLIMEAEGDSHRNGTQISVGAVNISFEATVEVSSSSPEAWGGIDLGTDGIMTNGVTSTFSEAAAWRLLGSEIPAGKDGRIFLKIKNLKKDISFYYSVDGETWISFGKGLRSNGSYSIRLFAWGKGEIVFRNFKYHGLE